MTIYDSVVTGRGYSLAVEARRDPKKSNGHTVLFCHGLGVTSRYPMLRYLGSALMKRGFTVMYFDLAGHGLSTGTVRQRMVGNFIKDIRDVVRWIGNRSDIRSEGLSLIGHSIGALAALAYVAKSKVSILQLILIGCNAESGKKYLAMKKAGRTRRLKKYVLIGRTKVALNFWTNRVRYEPKNCIAQVRLPILLACGKEDVTNPPEESSRLYAWSRSRRKHLALLPGCDHYFKSRREQLILTKAINQWIIL